MASQVLSGSGNVSYTNNTGQNVRVVINFINSSVTSSSGNFTISFGGASYTTGLISIGRNLAVVNANPGGIVNGYGTGGYAPTEIMLSPGQTFSVTGPSISAYNIVVIPEAG